MSNPNCPNLAKVNKLSSVLVQFLTDIQSHTFREEDTIAQAVLALKEVHGEDWQTKFWKNDLFGGEFL